MSSTGRCTERRSPGRCLPVFHIDQQFAVRNRRRVFDSCLNFTRPGYICLAITRVLEQYHVLRNQTNDATLLCLALHEIEDGCVGVMILFNEQGRDLTVRFRHDVVYDHQVLRICEFDKPSSKFKFGTVSINVAYMGCHSNTTTVFQVAIQSSRTHSVVIAY